MYNFLVIHGLGYLGSNFIRHILNNYNDYRIINLDNFEKIYDPLYDIQHKNYFFIKGDCNEYNLLLYLLHQYDINIIINFSLDCSDKTWYHIMKYNNLINACLNYGKLTKFINMSTEDLYSISTDNLTLNEYSEIYPNTEFACVNMYIENLLKYYYDKFKLPYISCRICSIFGNIYNQNKDDLYQKVYDFMNNNIMNLNNDGNDKNTYLHILDFCEALCIIVKESHIDNVYNIGSVSMHTESEIYKYINEKHKTTNVSYEINYVKNLNFYKNKKCMDIKKIYELGWNGPSISIFDEIDKYVSDITKN